MKFKKNEKYASIAMYSFITIFAVALLCLTIINFDKVYDGIKKLFAVLTPLTYGFVIAYLCNPLVRLFETKVYVFKKSKKNRSKLRRILSILTSFIIIVASITAFMFILVPQIIASYEELSGQVGNYLNSAQAWADNFIKNFALFQGKYENLSDFLDVNDLSTDLHSMISNSFKYLELASNYIIDYAGKFVIEMKNLLIGIFLSFYFIYYKERLSAQIKKLLASILNRSAYINTVNVARYTHRAFGGFITAKLLDSLIIGLLTFIVTGIFGIPFYPLISLVIGITNIIPVFGPIIGAIPTSFIVLIAEPKKTIIFIILVIVIQQIDGNVIGPRILGDKVGVSAMWVMISIAVFGELFGIPGMLLGVPTFAVLYTLVKQRTEYKLRAKNLPDSTEFYRDDPPDTDFETTDIIQRKGTVNESGENIVITVVTGDGCDPAADGASNDTAPKTEDENAENSRTRKKNTKNSKNKKQ